MITENKNYKINFKSTVLKSKVQLIFCVILVYNYTYEKINKEE